MSLKLALALFAQDVPPPPVALAPPEGLSELEQTCLDAHGEEDQAALAQCLGIVDPLYSPLDEVEAEIATLHPSQVYIFAARLLNEAQRPDDALFWFYAGQLRWRAQLTCNPPEPSGEGALFGAMQAMVGEEINQYAASDVDNWIATIGRVLEWDAVNPDPLLPSGCEEAREGQRKGLVELVRLIEEQRAKGEL